MKAAWQKTFDDLPAVPMAIDAKTGKKHLMPGETFASKHNIEHVELYAIFPYRLYTPAAGDNE